MSQLTQGLTPPQIYLQPNPEPPGFAQIRQMLEEQLFQRNANPYGMNPYGSMQSNPLNPFGGQGLFNPYTGQRDTSGATNSGVPNFAMPGVMGGGGGGGGLQQFLQMLQGGAGGGMAGPPQPRQELGGGGGMQAFMSRLGPGGPAQQMPGGIQRQPPSPGQLAPPPQALGSYDGVAYDAFGPPIEAGGSFNRRPGLPNGALGGGISMGSVPGHAAGGGFGAAPANFGGHNVGGGFGPAPMPMPGGVSRDTGVSSQTMPYQIPGGATSAPMPIGHNFGGSFGQMRPMPMPGGVPRQAPPGHNLGGFGAMPMPGGMPLGGGQPQPHFGPPPTSVGGNFDGVRYDAIGPTAVGGGGGYYQYGSAPGAGTFYSWSGQPAGGNAATPPGGQPAPPPTSTVNFGNPTTPSITPNPNYNSGDPGFVPNLGGGGTPGSGLNTVPRPNVNTSPFRSSGNPIDPNNPNPGDPNANHHFDGQITNPQPYPDEQSPMPYDGTPAAPEASMIDRAIAHLKQIFGMGGAPSEAPKQIPAPTPTPAVVKRTDIFLPDRKGMNLQHQQETAEDIINDTQHDGTAYDAYNAVQMGMRPSMLSHGAGVAPHIHAPMSLPPSAQHIGMPKNPMAGLNHILGGMGSANRRGQIASYRVGRPGSVFDGTEYDGPLDPTNPPRMGVSSLGTRTLPGEAPATSPTSGTAIGFNSTGSLPGSGGTPAGTPTYGTSGAGTSAGAYPTGGQTLGAPMYPWLMPYTGQRTAPMSPFQQQGLGGASAWMQGNMGLDPAFQYNQDLLSGKYIGSGSPYMQQIQQGAQGLKNQQDALAQARIASSMAAGGNALSGARAMAGQQYQNASDSAFQQQMGQMNLQDLQQERALQNQGVGQAMGLGNQLMGGYGSLMNMGSVPQQTQQNDLNAQYSDWLRQIGAMQQGDQFQQQMANQTLHSGYPGSSQPQYGQSTLAGLAGLLGGTGLVGSNGSLLSTNGSGGLINGLISGLGNLLSPNSTDSTNYDNNAYNTNVGNWGTPDNSNQDQMMNDWLTNWLSQYGGNTGGAT